ncbi:hypothetical protein KGQ25_01360 [Patescibacteria group bacterium]|nr:hypothetical protein [Patescibacteria group bacterium]MDE2021633.1 hypothetical protein [Patescibacteria group bacterium]
MSFTNKASNGMNNRESNNKSRLDVERRMLPFFIEFVKFSTGFAAIVALALLALHFVSASS